MAAAAMLNAAPRAGRAPGPGQSVDHTGCAEGSSVPSPSTPPSGATTMTGMGRGGSCFAEWVSAGWRGQKQGVSFWIVSLWTLLHAGQSIYACSMCAYA